MCLESAKRKIAEEYEAYKKEVLRCNNAEVIWDLCNRIAFFSCVLEYFEFSETIPEAFLSLVEKLVHPIYMMWNLIPRLRLMVAVQITQISAPITNYKGYVHSWMSIASASIPPEHGRSSMQN